MKLGLLKDIKKGEYRVILTPKEVGTIVSDGHSVLVEKNAGIGAGFSDEEFILQGATIVDSAVEIYSACDMVVKVKEIEESEYELLRENQIIYCCIHPAAHREEVDALLKSKCISITAEDSHRYGSPNCEAAGKIGALIGVEYLSKLKGGSGKLVCGLAGAPGINVIILGGGNVGQGSIQILNGLGAHITVFDINIGLMRELETRYDGKVNTMLSTKENIESIIGSCDLLINAVKWPKGRDDFLVTRDMLLKMNEGSVLVDISNDDNGAIESFRETTHEDPIYFENGVLHYCVSNIPSISSNTTSIAYAASVVGHIRSILNNGLEEALTRDGFLRRSLTTYKGYLTHEETSALQDRPWIKPEDILGLDVNRLDPAPRATISRSDNFIRR